jgi:hypothetical protein
VTGPIVTTCKVCGYVSDPGHPIYPSMCSRKDCPYAKPQPPLQRVQRQRTARLAAKAAPSEADQIKQLTDLAQEQGRELQIAKAQRNSLAGQVIDLSTTVDGLKAQLQQAQDDAKVARAQLAAAPTEKPLPLQPPPAAKK